MIGLLVTIAIIGLLAWVLITVVPMPAPMQKVLVAVACLIVLLIVLQTLGGVGGMPVFEWRR